MTNTPTWKKFRMAMRSPTFVVSVLVAIAGAVEMNLGMLKQFVSPQLFGAITVTLSTLAALLRVMTLTLPVVEAAETP